MLASQKLAIAAHLHVLLRRKTGRVTDPEWMAENLAYALEVVRFARAKAAEEGHAELAEWADKLEKAALSPAPAPHKPLVQAAAQLLAKAPVVVPPPPPASAPRNSGFEESTLEPDAKKGDPPGGLRYIGGIR
jgi:hypothetical protein